MLIIKATLIVIGRNTKQNTNSHPTLQRLITGRVDEATTSGRSTRMDQVYADYMLIKTFTSAYYWIWSHLLLLRWKFIIGIICKLNHRSMNLLFQRDKLGNRKCLHLELRVMYQDIIEWEIYQKEIYVKIRNQSNMSLSAMK